MPSSFFLSFLFELCPASLIFKILPYAIATARLHTSQNVMDLCRKENSTDKKKTLYILEKVYNKMLMIHPILVFKWGYISIYIIERFVWLVS
jgi:hypothetical protein